jgi:hypothetical protein
MKVVHSPATRYIIASLLEILEEIIGFRVSKLVEFTPKNFHRSSTL